MRFPGICYTTRDNCKRVCTKSDSTDDNPHDDDTRYTRIRASGHELPAGLGAYTLRRYTVTRYTSVKYITHDMCIPKTINCFGQRRVRPIFVFAPRACVRPHAPRDDVEVLSRLFFKKKKINKNSNSDSYRTVSSNRRFVDAAVSRTIRRGLLYVQQLRC